MLNTVCMLQSRFCQLQTRCRRKILRTPVPGAGIPPSQVTDGLGHAFIHYGRLADRQGVSPFWANARTLASSGDGLELAIRRRSARLRCTEEIGERALLLTSQAASTSWRPPLPAAARAPLGAHAPLPHCDRASAPQATHDRTGPCSRTVLRDQIAADDPASEYPSSSEPRSRPPSPMASGSCPPRSPARARSTISPPGWTRRRHGPAPSASVSPMASVQGFD